LGLRGIVFAPFIHYSINHLILNSAPLAFLSWLVLTKGTTNFLRVSLTVLLTSGFLVWALARPQYHIGASGLVLGYFSYLVTNSLIERSWSALLMGAATVLIYGGLLLTVLPMEGEVSWENHLAGLVAGALAAIVLVPNEKEKR
ncbi:MAG: membrane associated rhomboid family serine protease, partial [Planctomycetota bacterium]